MKNIKKLIGIIAIVAVIGIALISCDDDNETETTHTHQWGGWQLTDPTCTSKGEEKRTCTLDSNHIERIELPINPNAHNWSNYTEPTSATHTTEGVKTRTCSYNNTHTETQVVSARIPFTTVSELQTWYTSVQANTTATPYTINLQTNDITGIRDALGADTGNKYVILDLTGSTITTIPANTFYGSANPRGTPALVGVIIPNSVTIIQIYAFQGCTSLTSVTIPNSVTTIGMAAFQSCSSLTSITIPNSVTTIGTSAFLYCASLTAINVDSGNTAFSSQDDILYNKDKTTLFIYPPGKTDTSFTIPNSINNIEGNAFNDCRSLTSVTIPNSVTSIGFAAFSGCRSLASVTLPTNASFTTIASSAFDSCTSLTSVTIPNSVTTIGSTAFSNCSSLTSVTFERADTTGIGSTGISGASNLQTAYTAGGIGTYKRSGTTWTKQ